MLRIDGITEKWIPGYDGLYSIDVDGNVWSHHQHNNSTKGVEYNVTSHC